MKRPPVKMLCVKTKSTQETTDGQYQSIDADGQRGPCRSAGSGVDLRDLPGSRPPVASMRAESRSADPCVRDADPLLQYSVYAPTDLVGPELHGIGLLPGEETPTAEGDPDAGTPDR